MLIARLLPIGRAIQMQYIHSIPMLHSSHYLSTNRTSFPRTFEANLDWISSFRELEFYSFTPQFVKKSSPPTSKLSLEFRTKIFSTIKRPEKDRPRKVAQTHNPQHQPRNRDVKVFKDTERTCSCPLDIPLPRAPTPSNASTGASSSWLSSTTVLKPRTTRLPPELLHHLSSWDNSGKTGVSADIHHFQWL